MQAVKMSLEGLFIRSLQKKFSLILKNLPRLNDVMLNINMQFSLKMMQLLFPIVTKNQKNTEVIRLFGQSLTAGWLSRQKKKAFIL